MHARADGPAIALCGVEKSWRSTFGRRATPLLRGIDLELARGATLGLAGPNGSGKSTLLRILVGVEDHDTGEVAVLGTTPRAAARAGRIGWLAEEAPWPRELSLRAALRLVASLQGVASTGLAERCDAWLARVGLADRASTRVGRASRGMLRRFGLAQAWIHEPQLVLLDEPSAGLDAPGYVVLESLLDEARERGTTVVLASHVESDLTRRCDRLVVLLDGRVAASGAPSELLARSSLADVYRRSASGVA